MTQNQWNDYIGTEYEADSALSSSDMFDTALKDQTDLVNRKNRRLQERTNRKLKKIGMDATPTMLESVPDADSLKFVGVQGGKGSIKDATGVHTDDRDASFDSYETFHDGEDFWDYRTSNSGIAKYEKQRKRLAREAVEKPVWAKELGIKDVNNITDDDIARAGEWERLATLYHSANNDIIDKNIIKKGQWRPTVKQLTRDTHLELGSEENPLNIPVLRQDTEEIGAFGRHLTNIGTKDGYLVSSALGYDNVMEGSGDSYNANLLERGGNTLASGASMFLQGFAGIADMGAEAIQKVGNSTGIDALHSDGEGIWKDGEVSTSLDELLGVDNSYVERAQQEGAANWDAYKATGDKKYLLKGALAYATTPEMLGVSVGFVAGGGAIGVGAKAGKLAYKANKLRKAALGKGIKLEQSNAKAIIKNVESQASKSSKILTKIVDTAPGLVGYSFNDLGQQRAEYKAKYGKDMPAAQQSAAFTLNMLTNGLDFFTEGAMLKTGSVIKDMAAKAFKNAPAEVQESTIKRLAKTATTGILDLGVEGATEGIQTIGQGYGVDMGHKSLSESVSDRSDDIANSILGGVGGAGQFKAMHSAKRGLGYAGKAGLEYYNNTSDHLASGDEVEPPLTSAGRRTMWESMDNPDFKVSDKPETKKVYSRVITQSAAELLSLVRSKSGVEELVKRGYAGKDKTKNYSKVMDEAVDKMAKVHNVTDPKEKDMLYGVVASNIYNEMEGAKDSFNDNELNEFIRDVASTTKGTDKIATKLVQDHYDHVIQDEINKAKDELKESHPDMDVSGAIPLNEQSFNRIKQILKEVQSYGSEPLNNYATSLDEALEFHKQKYGSEPFDADGRKHQTKNMSDVSKEVALEGYFTGKRWLKSTQAHKDSIEAALEYPVEEMSNSDIKDVSKDFNIFANSRQNKVNSTVIDNSDKNGRRIPLHPQQIMHFINTTKDENKKLLDIANEAIPVLENKLKAVTDKSSPEYTELSEALKYMTRSKEVLDDVAAETEEYMNLAKAGDGKGIFIKALEASKSPRTHDQDENGKYTSYKQYIKDHIDSLGNTKFDFSSYLDELDGNPQINKNGPSSKSSSVSGENTTEKIKYTEQINKLQEEIDHVTDLIDEHYDIISNINTDIKDLKDEIDKQTPKLKEWKSTLKAKRKELFKLTKKHKKEGLIESDKLIINGMTKTVKQILGYVKSLITRTKNKIDNYYELKNNRRKLFKRKEAYYESINRLKEFKKELEESRLSLLVNNIDTLTTDGSHDGLLRANSKSIKSSPSLMLHWLRTNRGTIKDFKEGMKELLPSIVKSSNEEHLNNRLNNLIDVLNESNSESFAGSRADIQVRKQIEESLDGILNSLVAVNVNEKSFNDVLESNSPVIKDKINRALNVASLVALNGMQNIRTANSNDMKKHVESAYSSLLSTVDEVAYDHVIEILIDKTRNGEIVPIATYEESAGKRFLDELGVKLSNELTMSEKLDLEKSLGALVLSRLIKTGHSKSDGISLNALTIDNSGGLSVVTKTKREVFNAGIKSYVNVLDFNNFVGSEELKKLIDAGSLLEYTGTNELSQISLQPVILKKGKLTRRANTPMSDDVTDYLNLQNGHGFTFNDTFEKQIIEPHKLRMSNLINKNKIDPTSIINGINREELINEIAYYVLGGTVHDVASKAQAMSVPSTVSKYSADLLDIERMVDVYLMVGDKEFYTPWDHTKSGRNMLDNNSFNPQNSKISRFISSMNDMKTEVDLSNEDSVRFIYLAAGQATDIGDVDKQEDDDAIRDINKELFKLDGKNIIYADTDAGRALKAAVESDKPMKILRDGFGFSTNEHMHTLQLVDLLKSISGSDKNITKFVTNLVLEADGITNGMSIMLQQMGYTASTLAHLEKTYVYKQKEDGTYEYNNHGDFKKSGKPDIYQSPEAGFKDRLGGDLAEKAILHPNTAIERKAALLLDPKNKYTIEDLFSHKVKFVNDEPVIDEDSNVAVPYWAKIAFADENKAYTRWRIVTNSISEIEKAIENNKNIPQLKDKIEELTNKLKDLRLDELTLEPSTSIKADKTADKKLNNALNKMLDTINDNRAFATTNNDSAPLLNNINKIVGKSWRNFLKDPVMIFIYGAGMKNIRKAMARSLVVGNSYISGGVAKGKLEELAGLAGMDIKDLNKYISYKIYDRETGKLRIMSEKEINNTKGINNHAVINEQGVEELTSRIDNNIGGTFEKEFNSQFGDVVKFRQSLKTVEELNYVIFKSELKKALNGKSPSDATPEELSKAYSKLLKDGTYYGAEAPTGTIQDYVKFEKSVSTGDSKENKLTVTIPGNVFQGNNNSVASLVMSKTYKDLAAAVGATGVATIHAVDGAIMIEGHTDAVLNVYDALILGINPTKHQLQVEKMNKAFMDINVRHSILGKSVQKLLNNADKFDVVAVDEQVRDDIFRIFNIGYKEREFTVFKEVTDLIYDLDNTHNARKAMEGSTIKSGQYYVSDTKVEYKDEDGTTKYTDGSYTKTIGKGEVEGVWKDGLEEEQKEQLTNILESFVKGLQLANTPSVEEETNSNDDTIQNNEQEIIDLINNKFKETGPSSNVIKNLMLKVARNIAETATDKSKFNTAFEEITKRCK